MRRVDYPGLQTKGKGRVGWLPSPETLISRRASRSICLAAEAKLKSLHRGVILSRGNLRMGSRCHGDIRVVNPGSLLPSWVAWIFPPFGASCPHQYPLLAPAELGPTVCVFYKESKCGRGSEYGKGLRLHGFESHLKEAVLAGFWLFQRMTPIFPLKATQSPL